MKNLLLCILLAIIMFIPHTVNAQDNINVYIDGALLPTPSSPFIENGSTMVPLRAILESYGLTVNWLEETQQITASKDSMKILMKINDNKVKVNNQESIIAVPPKIFNGYTYVPIRFISEAFGADVAWDDKTQSVYISFQGGGILKDLSLVQRSDAQRQAEVSMDKSVMEKYYFSEDATTALGPETSYIFCATEWLDCYFYGLNIGNYKGADSPLEYIHKDHKDRLRCVLNLANNIYDEKRPNTDYIVSVIQDGKTKYTGRKNALDLLTRGGTSQTKCYPTSPMYRRYFYFYIPFGDIDFTKPFKIQIIGREAGYPDDKHEITVNLRHLK